MSAYRFPVLVPICLPIGTARSEYAQRSERQKRPADVIGAAVKVMKIATGEIEEPSDEKQKKNEAAAELGQRGGQARAKKLSKKRRVEIAKEAAKARWAEKIEPR